MRRRTTDVRDRDVSADLFVCTHERDGLACCTDAEEEEEPSLCGVAGAAIGVFPHDEWFSGVAPADVPALLAALFGSAAEQLTQETGRFEESAISDR